MTPRGRSPGSAMRTARTPPHPLFVLPMADDAALALARALHARGESVGGLNGSLPSAEVCAAELARLQGDRVEVAQHTRLFELGELVAPVGVPGRLRTATARRPGPGRRLGRALHARRRRAGRPRPRGARTRGDRARRPARAGSRAAPTGSGSTRRGSGCTSPAPTRPAFGVARVGPVYTPPEQRRKGYAGAAVAEVSQHFLRRRSPGLPVHRPGQPDVQRHLPGARLPSPVVDQVNLRIVDGS